VPPLPYAQAGLTSRQAAVFLLQRLTFGAEPGQVDEVTRQGLESWVEEQLDGQLSDDRLETRLADLPSLHLSPGQERTRYCNRNRLVEMAEQSGLKKWTEGSDRSRQIYEARLREFKEAQQQFTYEDLSDELRYQKLLRCRYTRNQLREVLTDFWFNHFNVAALNDPVRINTMAYERDVLRPQALGSFAVMLLGTARHPAMLHYLNNAQSSAAPGVKTTLNYCYEAAPPGDQEELRRGQPLKRKNGGLNENYAREVMELHTLGVNGGYTQTDVTELARCLSGWTVHYPESENQNLWRLIEPGEILGYRHQGDFLFRADWHDAEAKLILGQKIPAGGGLEEGEAMLKHLAQHPSTARFISRKLAQRFVCDEPSPALTERLAARFQADRGQIRPVLLELFASPEFWAEAARPSKVKSPLEFVVSCLRCSGAEITLDRGQIFWLQRLGQPLYACGPPTGYPEDSRDWVSSGSLLNRMNFANQFSQNRIRGLQVNWMSYLGPDQEPGQALAPLLLPEREVALSEFSFQRLGQPGDGYGPRGWFKTPKPSDFESRRRQAWTAKVAGVLLGSPAFQYR
jgi:uncharacterized protein (DUF1800 family)